MAGILDFLSDKGPEIFNAIGGVGESIQSIGQNRPSNMQPYMQEAQRLGQQRQMEQFSQQVQPYLDGLNPKQQGILGSIMKANPQVGMGILAQHAFPAPSDPYAQYRNVGGALLDLGADGGPKEIYKSPQAGSRYYTVQTGQGLMMVDKHTGQYMPMQGGEGGGNLLPPSIDPAAQGSVTRARETAKTEVKNESVAPQKRENAMGTIALINQALEHPGFDKNFGMMGAVPNRPGSDASDSGALLDQLRGKAFLQAFDTLKGGGQITEREGIAAQNAYARLQASQSPEAARQALEEMRGAIEQGLEKMEQAGLFGAPQGQKTTPQRKPLSQMTLEELEAKARELSQ